MKIYAQEDRYSKSLVCILMMSCENQQLGLIFLSTRHNTMLGIILASMVSNLHKVTVK